MKLFKVYHVKEDKLTFGFGPHPHFPEDYEEVALVRVAELGEVFRVTNHIDHLWWENEEVVAHWKETRSTSVGDVVADIAEKKFYRCEMVGWSEVTING